MFLSSDRRSASVRSCPGDDNRIFAESECIELVHPKEVGYSVLPVSLPVPVNFGPGKSQYLNAPVLDPSVRGAAAGREHTVPSVLKSMPCERRPGRVAEIFKFPCLWIEHEQLVLRTINLRNG